MKTFFYIAYPLFLLAAIEGILGLIFLTRKHRMYGHRRAFAIVAIASAVYCLSAGIEYAAAGLGGDFGFAYRWTWVGWMTVPATLQFIYHQEDRPDRARLVGWILYPFWSAVLALAVLTNWIDREPTSLIPFEKGTAPLENVVRAIAAAMVVFAIVKGALLLRKLVGIRRAQLAFFYVGLTFYGVCGTFSAAVLPIIGGTRFDPALTCYFSFPWVVLSYYACRKYRLFDVKLVVSRLVAVVLVLALLAGVQLLIFRVVDAVLSVAAAMAISYALATALLFATPLSRNLERLVRAFIVRGKFDYQEALSEASMAVVSILELDDLLEYIVDLTERTINSDEVAVYLASEDGQFRLRCRDRGIDKVGQGEELSDHLIEWLEQTGEPFVLEEQELLLTTKQIDSLRGPEGGTLPFLAVPLSYRSQMLGVLALGRKRSGDPYNHVDLRLLGALASQAAVALENARLYEEGIKDPLTGIYHRRYCSARLAEELARARRHRTPMAVALLDVDNLKSVNDRFGHLVGDQVLVEVARQLSLNTRASDIVGRFGGDEFLVILPETSREDAAAVAERLRNAVATATATTSTDATVSIGVGWCNAEHLPDSPRSLMAAADAALYEAKDAGRNRTRLDASWAA